MKYVTLNNGIKMPIVGFGTARLTEKACIDAVKNAISSGYRLIDTAQMYHNESEVGIAIKESGVNREELFITTKIYSPSRSYVSAKKAINESLNNLGLDYIDLMLIHEPYDEAEEMYKALEDAYKEGKLRAIGVSNFNVERYLSFISKVSIIPAVNQVECHIYYQEKELQTVLESHGTVMESWSSLTALKRDILNDPVLISLGKKYNKTSAQIALKWLITRNIIIIPKSINKQRVLDNINLFDFELEKEDIETISKLDEGESLFGWY